MPSTEVARFPAEPSDFDRTPDAPDGGPFRLTRSRAVFLAKTVVAATLCGAIIARVDWSAAWQSLSATGPAPVGAMFVIMTLCVFLSAYKWQLLLAIHSVSYPFAKLTKYYFVAVFFNNFLPTSIGGDGYRIYKTFHNGRSKASAIIAVAMERLTGFGGLALLGIGAGLLLAAERRGGISSGAVAGGLALVAVPLVVWRLRSLVPRAIVRAVPRKVRDLHETIAAHFDDYARQPGRSVAVIAISLCFHLGVAFAYFLMLRFGGAQTITIFEVLTALAVSTLVAVLPVSINGIGVFEGTFIYLLAQYGVPADVSVVPMIVNRGLLITLSLVGASAYLLESATCRRPALSIAPPSADEPDSLADR